jgi:hypothetical protein
LTPIIANWIATGLELLSPGHARNEAILTRFLVKIHCDLDTKCWLWQGAISSGYGRFGVTFEDESGKSVQFTMYAHRWAYIYFVGPIRAGLELHHKCNVKRCVNPEHLEPVTHRSNIIAAVGTKSNAA